MSPSRTRAGSAPILPLLLILLIPAQLSAQRIHRMEAVVPPSAVQEERGGSAAGAFLASAVLPGAGQYRLGAGRWVAYAAVETWAWINWSDARAESRALEGAYRDLAWEVARRISVGRRRDREFEYYEAMSNYNESGSFDANPGMPGVQPEEDEATFNGTIWALARAIYFPAGGDSVPPTEQEQAAALDYYTRNAIEPEYAWSWGSNRLEQEHFRALIRRSDEAARATTTMLGVILVNHVVSAIDALLTARLRGDDGAGDVRLRGETRFGPDGAVPWLVLEIATP